MSQKEVDDYSNFSFTGKAKIGCVGEALTSDGVAEDIKSSTKAAVEKLKSEGHQVESIEFPLMDYFLPAYYILTTAEASSNLSRYDGIRYGHRTAEQGDLISTYKKTRNEGFGDEVKRRIMLPFTHKLKR